MSSHPPPTNIPPSFSPTAASTLALSISTLSSTLAAPLTLTTTTSPPPPSDAPNPDLSFPSDLAFLSTRLQQLSQHAHQLSEVLLDTATVAKPLQDELGLLLPEGEADVRRLEEIWNAGAGSTGGVDTEGWTGLMAAYSRVVIFATQILSINDEAEQERRMDHDEARELFAAPKRLRRGVRRLLVE